MTLFKITGISIIAMLTSSIFLLLTGYLADFSQTHVVVAYIIALVIWILAALTTFSIVFFDKKVSKLTNIPIT